MKLFKITAALLLSASLSAPVMAADKMSEADYQGFLKKMNAQSLTPAQMKEMKGTFDMAWFMGNSGFG
ncbi:MAG: hypothetical protein HON94_01905 [Methylococcales bacterium]|nr:hypothetical protein [Methylococcales bacterium]MBT7411138.1 hypothetical protein [Methylococcales bacterium]